MLVSSDLPTIFWSLGILSLVSVVLMAALLPRYGTRAVAERVVS
jgi:hypothetical protein